MSDYCIVCGMCAVECPSNVNIPKLMLEAKSRYRALHRATSTEAILSRAEAVSRLGSSLAPLTNRAMTSPVLRRLAEPLTGIDHRRPLARFTRCRGLTEPDARIARVGPLAGVPGRAARSGERANTGGTLVAYFHDLHARYNEPGVAWDSLAVLQSHGCETLVPPPRASGVPEMLYGYAEATRRVAVGNLWYLLPFVQSGAVVVASERTAVFALKIHYPDYLASEECSLVANSSHGPGSS